MMMMIDESMVVQILFFGFIIWNYSWVRYRVCVYISLMTSGEFVRFYSLSVGQDYQEHQMGSCVLHILDNIFG